jgi:phage tail sheath protein FI
MAEYLSPAVFIEEPPSGIKPIQAVGTSVAGFVGHARKGPIGVAVSLGSYAQFERTFGGPMDNGYLAFAVKAFFDEGGSSCYVVRTCSYNRTAGTPTPRATTASKTLQNSAATPVDAITVSASSAGSWANTLTIQTKRTGPLTDPVGPQDSFLITVADAGQPVEKLDRLVMDPMSRDYAPARVERLSSLIRVTDRLATAALPYADHRPADTTSPQALAPAVDGLPPETGITLVTADYIGDESSGAGLHAFDAVDDVNIIAIPEYLNRDVHVQGMAYCERRKDCFYVADVEEHADSATRVLAYKRAQGIYSGGNAFNSKYGALYAPWIDVIDPRTGTPHRIPPSGAVIGRYARTDGTRGVHKAPAGITDGRLATVVGLATSFSQADQEKLNPNGIDVIRQFTGVGNVIWGARTVSTDPEWRYLNVRRLFLMIEQSIARNTSWAVFEPNDDTLRKSLVRNISAFLRLQWLAGALVGATEEAAYFVKCDEENNPPESILAGRVITEIGIAPSKPAEFVIFRIEQFEGGSDVSD